MRESYLLSKHGEKNVLERRESMRNDNTKTVKPSNLLKKALCYMLTTVMVISGFNMVPGAVIESEAADAWKFIELEEGRYKITPTYAWVKSP